MLGIIKTLCYKGKCNKIMQSTVDVFTENKEIIYIKKTRICSDPTAALRLPVRTEVMQLPGRTRQQCTDLRSTYRLRLISGPRSSYPTGRLRFVCQYLSMFVTQHIEAISTQGFICFLTPKSYLTYEDLLHDFPPPPSPAWRLPNHTDL